MALLPQATLALLACTTSATPSAPDASATSGVTHPGATETGATATGSSFTETTTSTAWPAGATILDGVRVVDVETVRESAAVILNGETIHAVTEAGGPWPDDATVHDWSGFTVIPGLIDAHVHLFHAGTTWWVGDTLADNLAAQLSWGVVGVADLGSPEEIFTLRDRIASGEIVGPRIWATGPFLTTEGSHPCETTYDRALCRFVDGDAAEQVAALAEADGLKVALADADFTPWPTTRLDLTDLAEITAASAQPVQAHIDEEIDALDALDAGVDVLAHPVFAADLDTTPDAPVHSTQSAFAGTNALISGELLADDLSATPAAVREAWAWLAAHPETFAEGWLEESERWEAHARANTALAIAEGRPVLAGSDAGYWFVPHGLGLHRELAWLVEAGMTPVQALAAATAVPAEILGWSDLGRVAPGMRADLLVVSGRVDEDITAARAIAAIYLGGTRWTSGDDAWTEQGDGGFCLDDRDCAEGRCDRVDHVCRDACAPAYDRAGSCDVETWCAPADGLDTTTEGVCRPGHGCDLISQDCAPAWYGEACVPADIDTNVCWPSGPRQAGQTCSWSDPELFCEAGAWCSWNDGRCYQLCEVGASSPDCLRCVQQEVEGLPWFGLCL